MNKNLRPFHGFFSPGLYFTSGHGMRLYNFTSVPTDVEAFFQIWAMTPRGKKILYVDPEAANAIISTWYSFDEVVGSTISWEWSESDTLHIDVEADDDTTLELRLTLGSSLATTILNTIITITPRALMRTGPMLAISGLSFNLLLGLGGVHIRGETETGKDYVTEADRLAVVKDASAVLNGEDLGPLTRPPRPIYFGPSRVADHAVFAFGTANLEVTRATA
jgi:hypothetical protein